MTALFERAPDAPHFQESDRLRLKAELERTGAKTVLEFGPGDSTEFFLECGVETIVTCEHNDHWLEVARERFKDEPRVTVLKFHDEMPVVVEGLDPEEGFDIAFVDGPQGYDPLRKVHAGYEDCSRFNTLSFALERCKVVLLHDAQRPLEKNSLRRLRDAEISFLTAEIGMARIERR